MLIKDGSALEDVVTEYDLVPFDEDEPLGDLVDVLEDVIEPDTDDDLVELLEEVSVLLSSGEPEELTDTVTDRLPDTLPLCVLVNIELLEPVVDADDDLEFV